jgi:predicted dehydrogenase
MDDPFQNRKIRWGIIGLGNIAHSFSEDLLTIEDAELYGVASRSHANAEAFRLRYKAKKAFGSYMELVKDSQVDAVYIATPHSFHKAHALLCLEHGKAVLCEKPFAMNEEEVTEMISKAREMNILLMEALWTYFLPHYKYVLELVHRKTFGRVLQFEADFGFKAKFAPEHRLFKKSLGGGSLLDIGIYPIFAALSTLGIPSYIQAEATFYDNGVDSTCDVMLKYSDDCTAILKSTLLDYTPTEALFRCENGIIKVNSRFHEPTNVSLIINGKTETIDFDQDYIGYRYEVIHFHQLLRARKTESDIMSFDFSQKLIGLLDQVRNNIGLVY